MRNNSILITHPDIAKYWDYGKNSLNIEDITLGSHKKAWWLCDKGHSYEMIVSRKIKNNPACQYCENRKLLVGYNDLATISPELITLWDNDKNTIPMNKVITGTGKKYWWLCDKGHSYQKSVHEIQKYSECPYCTGKIITEGTNDLFTLYPHLEKEWDYDKNTSLNPKRMYKFSTKKAWWKCKKGHEWETVINSRTNMKSGCPYCARKIADKNNNITISNPEILQYWDWDKNDILPENLLKGSNKKVWLNCMNNHSVFLTVSAFVRRGISCKYCNSKEALKGFNDLETKYPEISLEWNYDKNNFNPDNYTYGWWVCSKGHEWHARIDGRTGKKSKVVHNVLLEELFQRQKKR